MREHGLDLQIWQVQSGDEAYEGPDTTRWPQDTMCQQYTVKKLLPCTGIDHMPLAFKAGVPACF